MNRIERFEHLVSLSLDNDLKEFAGPDLGHIAMELQMLRIMRGRPFKIELNGPNDTSKGWSPDGGVTWLPSEPGTFTTSSLDVSPELK